MVTDSNPLVPILNDRRLDQVTNDRLLKMKMALDRYTFRARHQKGTKHVIADAFSRAPRHDPTPEDMLLTPEDDADREYVIASALVAMQGEAQEAAFAARTEAADSPLAPVNTAVIAAVLENSQTGRDFVRSIDDMDEQVAEIRKAGQRDGTYQDLIRVIADGWPEKQQLKAIHENLTPFYTEREHLMVYGGVILHGPRLFIPPSMRRTVLDRLHAAHLGINKTTERASRSVWWPGITADVKHRVEACQTCRERLPSHPHEPMQHGPDATRPFQKIHVDLFMAAGRNYLVATDEFTGWPCLQSLENTTSTKVIDALREVFLAHAAPVVLRTDGGPQLVSTKVKDFLVKWGVRLDPSSPHLSRSNGRAEAAVKFLKKLVLGCIPIGGNRPDNDKLALGIAGYRNSPRYGGRSPAELLLGHNARDGVPTHHSAYDVKWKQAFRTLDHTAETQRGKLEANYDQRSHRLRPLPSGTPVWVQHNATKRWTMPGTIVESLPKGEYLVRKPSGRILRRNRVFLRERKLFVAPPGGVLEPQRQQPAVKPPAEPAAPPAAEPPAAPPAPPAPFVRQPPRDTKRKKTPPPPSRTSTRQPKQSTRYPADKYVTSWKKGEK